MELHSQQIRAREKFKSNKYHGIAWWLPGEGKTRLGLATLEDSKIRWAIYVARKESWKDIQTEVKNCGLTYYCQPMSELDEATVERCKVIALITPDSLHKITPFFPVGDSMLILDELHLFSNVKSKRGKLAAKIAATSQAVIGMSATIMPARNNITIYGQAKCIGLHLLLAPTLTEFYEKYQTNVFCAFSPSKKQWINKPNSYNTILKELGDYTDLHYPTREERNIKSQIIHTKLSNEQKNQIKLLQSTWEVNGRELSHAISIAHEIAKIGGGWNEDKEGNLLHYKCPKAERLIVLVQELYDASQSCVVWCAYRNDIKYLQSILPFKTLVYQSGTSFDPKSLSSDSPVIVLATEAYGLGVNHFRDIQYGIYYSLTRKWTDLQQSQGRHERKDSKHGGAFYYYLINEDSEVETTIYNCVIESKNAEVNFITGALIRQYEQYKRLG